MVVVVAESEIWIGIITLDALFLSPLSFMVVWACLVLVLGGAAWKSTVKDVEHHHRTRFGDPRQWIEVDAFNRPEERERERER